MADEKKEELTPRQQYEKETAEKSQADSVRAEQDMVTEVGNDNYRYDPDYNQFADFLGVDAEMRGDHDLAQKIDLIYQWGERQAKSSDRVDVSLSIKSLKDLIGLNVQGKTLVDKLYQWVRLDQDRRRINKEMELVKPI